MLIFKWQHILAAFYKQCYNTHHLHCIGSLNANSYMCIYKWHILWFVLYQSTVVVNPENYIVTVLHSVIRREREKRSDKHQAIQLFRLHVYVANSVGTFVAGRMLVQPTNVLHALMNRTSDSSHLTFWITITCRYILLLMQGKKNIDETNKEWFKRKKWPDEAKCSFCNISKKMIM